MMITLIGMSGAGKSHWSKKLEERGFVRFCCDDLLEKKLKRELKPLGYSGVGGVSAWMGQPYEERYPKTSKKYLELEKELMRKILQELKSLKSRKIVIDTTGSVIYTGDSIMNKLHKQTKVVYLNVPESVKKEMHQLYLRDPKPVVWGSMFKKRNGEEDLQALARCYPKLLRYRTNLYKRYADVTLDYFLLRKPGITTREVLEMIA